MNGILIIDKQSGMTSRDVVNKISKIFKTKKVGHTGTLDPLATGVLVVCINKATKLADRITSNDKEYIAECMLGIETDTIDIEGKVLQEKKAIINKSEIISILNEFKGSYNQEVPKYSAVKIKGKKLYEYARENKDIKLPSRKVIIKDIKLIGDPVYENNKTKFNFFCCVSKGTYIRSLIRDIAYSLDTVGIMTNLRRIKQGKFKIDDAVLLDKISNKDLIPISDILGVKKIELSDNIEKKVLNGAKIENIYNEDEVLFMKGKKEIALYKKDENDKLMKVNKMFEGGII